MKIEKTYKYEKDGIVYVGTNIPEDAELMETMDILCSEEGYELVRISDNENVGESIWLKDGDVQENYKEIEHKEKDNADN